MKTVPIDNFKQSLKDIEKAVRTKMDEYEALSPADKCGANGTDLIDWLEGFFMTALEDLNKTVTSECDETKQELDARTGCDVENSNFGGYPDLEQRTDDLDELSDAIGSLQAEIAVSVRGHNSRCTKGY
jgi:hypothetical protein